MATTHTSFLQREIEVRIVLSKGQFKDGGNTKIINGLATTVSVEKLAWPDAGKASIAIKGMSLDDMQQLSTLNFRPLFHARNYVNIYAGDSGGSLTQIFAGNITKAGADFNSAPDVVFKMEAQIGFYGAIKAQGPNVINGTQDAASFIEGQCTKAGFTFSNEDVTGQLRNCVFNGSPMHQAQAAAKQIGAELVLDDDTATLVQKDTAKKGNTVVLSKESGLIGYPTITQSGIECKCIFNPDIRFHGMIKIETIVPKASGTWRVIKLAHKLSANDPKSGEWVSQITGYPRGMFTSSGYAT